MCACPPPKHTFQPHQPPCSRLLSASATCALEGCLLAAAAPTAAAAAAMLLPLENCLAKVGCICGSGLPPPSAPVLAEPFRGGRLLRGGDGWAPTGRRTTGWLGTAWCKHEGASMKAQAWKYKHACITGMHCGAHSDF
eukprot:1151838-Pelagomonas_calceolata.AAC.4